MSASSTVKLLLLVLTLKEISPQSTLEEGDLRLISGSIFGGRLEIYINEKWSSICYSDFDVYEGDIACKQLHFLYSSAVETTKSLNYSTGNGSKVLSKLNCSTSDEKLINCSTSSENCADSSLEVALECTNKSSALRLVSDSGRTEGLSSGRLEIYINNKWGTVCSTSFSQVEADMACIQMGHEKANGHTQTLTVGYQDATKKPIWLSHISCSLTNLSTYDLRSCSYLGPGMSINCNHGNDVFLSCTSPGHIRLQNFESSTFTTNGQLQMYWNGQWLPICSYPYFSGNNALVACRQLGFEQVVGYRMERNDVKRFLLSDINCLSFDELTLLNCSHGIIGAPHSECGRSATSVFLSCEAINTTLAINRSSGGFILGFSSKGLIGGTIVFLIICFAIFSFSLSIVSDTCLYF